MEPSNMAVLTLLKAARATLANPAHWTKDTNARNITGRVVNAKDKSAVCWCASGVLIKHTNETADFVRAVLWLKAANHSDYKHGYKLADFNDHPETTHAQVIQLFDNAIAFHANDKV